MRAARERLAALPDARLARVSPIYETEPWGDADQPFFLNQVAALDLGPAWTPRRLLETLQVLETELGRTRSARRYGPRVLDLDILTYGQEQVDEPDLVVPHPRLRQRAFALVPLADIAPGLIFPDGEPIARALAKISFKISGNVIVERG